MRRTGLQLLNVEVRYRTNILEETKASKGRGTVDEGSPTISEQKQYQPIAFSQDVLDDLEGNIEGAESSDGPAFFLKPSISNFSAHVKVGERIGIVGRTGAGK